jgi:hypothetical protein
MNGKRVWNIGRKILMGKPKYVESNLFYFHFINHVSKWTGLGLNFDLCNDGLGKNREGSPSLFSCTIPPFLQRD